MIQILRQIENTLLKILGLLRLNTVRFSYTVGPVTNKQPTTLKKGNCMLEIRITNEQKVNVALKPVTATGKPAQVEAGSVSWESITGNSTVEPSEDGMSADLISADDPGDTDFLVKADADLGEGVVEISDVIRLSVAGAMAANLGLVAGEPQAK